MTIMAKTLNVKVKEGAFPIFYAGKRYATGQVFAIDETHVNESTMEIVEETPKKVSRAKAVTADAE